jgi:hypothetical protein
MGTAATKAKRKWNKEHYTNVTAAMNPQLASKLKKSCEENGVSITSVITGLVARFLDAEVPAPKEKPQKKDPDNRRRRAREIEGHIAAIEGICCGEEQYFNNMPENLHSSIRYKNAEKSVRRLRTAIDELKEAYPERRG